MNRHRSWQILFRAFIVLTCIALGYDLFEIHEGARPDKFWFAVYPVAITALVGLWANRYHIAWWWHTEGKPDDEPRYEHATFDATAIGKDAAERILRETREQSFLNPKNITRIE